MIVVGCDRDRRYQGSPPPRDAAPGLLDAGRATSIEVIASTPTPPRLDHDGLLRDGPAAFVDERRGLTFERPPEPARRVCGEELDRALRSIETALGFARLIERAGEGSGHERLRCEARASHVACTFEYVAADLFDPPERAGTFVFVADDEGRATLAAALLGLARFRPVETRPGATDRGCEP